MTNIKLTLTPVQALVALRVKDNQIIEGVKYYLDAPQGCDDINAFFPCAVVGNHEWVPSGETTDEKSAWVQIY